LIRNGWVDQSGQPAAPFQGIPDSLEFFSKPHSDHLQTHNAVTPGEEKRRTGPSFKAREAKLVKGKAPEGKRQIILPLFAPVEKDFEQEATEATEATEEKLRSFH
jgi:hypothetical protein